MGKPTAVRPSSAFTTVDLDRAGKQVGFLMIPHSPNDDAWGVTRVPLAYPMYDTDYAERVGAIREWLEGITNLQQVGRNGLHRYNNSDHSMLTAIRAVDNIQNGARHDIWAVNEDAEYHESGDEGEQAALASERLVPKRLKAA